MSDLNIASKVLGTAAKAVLQERKDQHGDAENSFHTIAMFWQIYLVDKVKITGHDVANMMALLKIARAMHGNKHNIDHYADGAGYLALSAMLAGDEDHVAK